MSDPNNTVETNTPSGTGSEPTTPQTPSAFEVSENSILKFKDGDQEQQLSWKDLQTQRMLHKDYTQKRQADADARRQFETEREAFTRQKDAVEQQQRALAEIVTDDQKLAALYMAAQARKRQAEQPQQMTPESFSHHLEKLRQDVVVQQQEQLRQFRIEQEAQRLEQELDNFTRTVVKDYPVLAAVEGIEDAIYNKVAALKPASLSEAKEQIKLAVEARHQAVQKALEEKGKRDAIDKEKATKGIERGGQVQLPAGKKYTSLNDKNLSKDMTSFFEQFFKDNPDGFDGR